MKRYFSKEDTQMVNMYMKRYSTFLVIRKTHTKTTKRHHLTHDRMDITKKIRDDKC